MAVAWTAQIYGVYCRPPTRLLAAVGRRLMRVRRASVRTIPHTLCPLTSPHPGSRPHRGTRPLRRARCLDWAERPTAGRLHARLHLSRARARQPRLTQIRNLQQRQRFTSVAHAHACVLLERVNTNVLVSSSARAAATEERTRHVASEAARQALFIEFVTGRSSAAFSAQKR